MSPDVFWTISMFIMHSGKGSWCFKMMEKNDKWQKTNETGMCFIETSKLWTVCFISYQGNNYAEEVLCVDWMINLSMNWWTNEWTGMLVHQSTLYALIAHDVRLYLWDFPVIKKLFAAAAVFLALFLSSCPEGPLKTELWCLNLDYDVTLWASFLKACLTCSPVIAPVLLMSGLVQSLWEAKLLTPYIVYQPRHLWSPLFNLLAFKKQRQRYFISC